VDSISSTSTILPTRVDYHAHALFLLTQYFNLSPTLLGSGLGHPTNATEPGCDARAYILLSKHTDLIVAHPPATYLRHLNIVLFSPACGYRVLFGG
jgi:hypothetical protein